MAVGGIFGTNQGTVDIPLSKYEELIMCRAILEQVERIISADCSACAVIDILKIIFQINVPRERQDLNDCAASASRTETEEKGED